MTPRSPRIVRDNSTASIGLVFAAAWAAGVPWSVLHGSPDPLTFVFQAFGASVIPMVAGWGTLWRTKGDRKGALVAVMVVSGVLLAAEVWRRVKMGA